MKHRRIIVVIATAGVIIVGSALIVGQLFIASNEQRHASCDGTLVALRAISETNVAGLRAVALIPPGIDESLFKSFKLQQAQTIQSNNRRLKVIKDVNVEIVKLEKSHFCN